MYEKKKYFLSTGNNGKGVKFDDYEMELLTILTKHRYLTSLQLRDYMQSLTDISNSGFKNRLYKWAHKRVVALYNVKKDSDLVYYFGGPHNRVTITKRGVKFLIKHGYLEEEWAGKIHTSIPTPRIQDRYLCAQSLVIQILMEFKDYPGFISSSSIERRKSYLIDPDWVIETNTQLLLIQADADEKYSEIRHKIQGYIQFAQENPEVNINVMIPIVDGTIGSLKFYPGKRGRRVTNFKKIISEEFDGTLPNLKFYVSQYSKSYAITRNILK
ncbi:hypothetical protein MUN89_18015 [Halobacillus salinarum]|uniref:Replication-relaxation n=1 Tax=Halobacillus salinarum TaxID=2932257 RepID=A0ABY4EJQ8_9BACI|nr:hypothetical protein [Halobacillus salinarum]UOQ43757.1 hypothetical protein MUN89_18015 [Halobacillus salinarum]